MTVNIEKMRADMAAQQKQLDWETRKFIVQLLLGTTAAIGAGVALATYVNGRPPLPAAPQIIQAPPQIIYLQPIAPPPAR